MTAKKMGRPPVDTEPVTIRMTRSMIGDIDEARRHMQELPTRAEVIRRVMAEWLKSQGLQSGGEGDG